MKSSIVKIGVPTNSRLAEDCAPVTDLLKLEKTTNGLLKSRLLPATEIFPVRARTIARYLRDQIFQFGILGDDTAVDEGLDEIGVRTFPDGRPSSESPLIFNPITPEQCAACGNKSTVVSAELKCFSLGSLPKTKLSLLLRNEDAAKGKFPMQEGIVTSYPRATKKILGAPVVEEDGQLEFLLRNMPDRFSAAVDIVRSGETARQFGLEPVQTLLESRPGVWRSLWRSPTGDSEMDSDRANQLIDTRAILRERLKPLI